MPDFGTLLEILLAILVITPVVVLLMIPYLYLTVSVYPWLLMHPTARGGQNGDRGVKRVTYPGGRGVVYMPEPRVRRYLAQYALFTHEGGTYIRCAVDERVAYLAYDVVTFDARGRLLDIVSVDERIEVAGQTHPVRLPTKTAYARLLLRQVDGLRLPEARCLRYDGRGMLLLTLCNVLTTLVYAVVVREGWMILRGTVGLTIPMPPAAAACVLVALLVGLGYSAWVIYRYTKPDKRRNNR